VPDGVTGDSGVSSPETSDDRLERLHSLYKDMPDLPPNIKHFGVGPTPFSALSTDRADDAKLKETFTKHGLPSLADWYEAIYRKKDATGKDVGPHKLNELSSAMHRGDPSKYIMTDYLRSVHQFIGLGEDNWVGLVPSGGHGAFAAMASSMLGPDVPVYIDTPAPGTDDAKAEGAFRQAWARSIKELYGQYDKTGLISTAGRHEGGTVPTPDELNRRLEFGPGKETKVYVGVAGATTAGNGYNEQDFQNLVDWVLQDPKSHHVILDMTSMVGAMPKFKNPELEKDVLRYLNFFTPVQKALVGRPGFGLCVTTPNARELINEHANTKQGRWSVPRQYQLAGIVDKTALEALYDTSKGPHYNPEKDAMEAEAINTFDPEAVAESLYRLECLKQIKARNATELSELSRQNRQILERFVEKHSDRFRLTVSDKTRRSNAVGLLDVLVDGEDATKEFVEAMKGFLSYDGIALGNASDGKPCVVRGRDGIRYINPYPGAGGDIRFWINGAVDQEDLTAFLECLNHAWEITKLVMELKQDVQDVSVLQRPSQEAVQQQSVAAAGAMVGASDLQLPVLLQLLQQHQKSSEKSAQELNTFLNSVEGARALEALKNVMATA